MRHLLAPYLALALSFLSATADARTLTIRQPGAPELTFTVPSGWKAVERRTYTVLTRGEQRRVLRQCPLARDERDMTGRHAARQHPGADPVPGGSCLYGAGGLSLHAELGRGGPSPRSDPEAEALAREARRRTMRAGRVSGQAYVTLFGIDRNIFATFEWDLIARYQHRTMYYGPVTAEVIHDLSGDHLREESPCWGGTSPAEQDDAFAPRLELREWDAPPSSQTAWRVAYEPVDGNTIRWTGFVADGEAMIRSDGRLHSVTIRDHHMARGRSPWSGVAMLFAYPPEITPVRPEPAC